MWRIWEMELLKILIEVFLKTLDIFKLSIFSKFLIFLVLKF